MFPVLVKAFHVTVKGHGNQKEKSLNSGLDTQLTKDFHKDTLPLVSDKFVQITQHSTPNDEHR